MRFGIREICDVVLRAKSTQKLGNRTFYKHEPVLYFDTLKTSSLEGAATTVYALGGRGNTRLVAWEGERTLTFTMEDALLSMDSFSILSGAGLLDASEEVPIYVHQTSQVAVKSDNIIVLPAIACWNADSRSPYFHEAADIFVMVLKDGEVNAEPCKVEGLSYDEDNEKTYLTCYSHEGVLKAGKIVLVDYYVKQTGNAKMIEITADKFGGNYYLEASTLFRRESDGVDMPAEFIIPNCKVQSNFTFSMAATGDPSTFSFTLDAFPDYTKFDQTHKVLAAILVITDEDNTSDKRRDNCVIDPDKQSSQPSSVTAYVGTGIDASVAEYNANQITISGIYDDSAVNFNTSVFGSSIPGKGVQITINLPVDKEGGSYTVILKNPGLAYFPSDPYIKDTIKEKTYTISPNGIFDYDFLVTEEEGDISIELQNATGNTVARYVIENKVVFN